MGRFIGQAASVRFRLARAGLHRNRSQSLLPSLLGRGWKVLHRYGNVWACKHDGLQFRSPRNSGCASAILNKFRLRSTCTEFVLAAEQVERATHALCNRQRVAGKHAQHPVDARHRGLHAKA